MIRWTKNELQKMHKKTKTVMTMNKELHLRSDTTRTLSIKEERGTSRDVQSHLCAVHKNKL